MIDELLNQARKFKIGLALAHQNLDQLYEHPRAQKRSRCRAYAARVRVKAVNDGWDFERYLERRSAIKAMIQFVNLRDHCRAQPARPSGYFLTALK
jgi:hypothetical protein